MIGLNLGANKDSTDRAGDFAAVLPDLKALLGLVRETAAAKGEALGLDPYDALLEAYEPGGRQTDIDPLFAALEAFLPDFLGRVLENQARRPAAGLSSSHTKDMKEHYKLLRIVKKYPEILRNVTEC